MRTRTTALAGLAVIGLSALGPLAQAGEWKYSRDQQDHDQLTYREDGKVIFLMGCGHAFAIHTRYPGAAAREGSAGITIASGKKTIPLKGEFEEPDEDMATQFAQYDLGYRRQDPQLYGKRWKAEAARLYDLLGSGQPLTISAGQDHYELPPVDAKGWRKPFGGCG